MKRRGNKSNKVPNVKLRPAQEGALPRLKRVETVTCWVEDSQAGSDDTSIADICPRPFKGIVICATGVSDKPALFKQALELGATSMSAFTDLVTHLVAVDHGGAKYMCALERKIPILTPSWITESYQIWLRGDDVDVQESVANHRLPIFSGVILCPSGIADITHRTEINKILTKHGGTYVKNLERPVKVTHLLCSGDEETDKMRYAEKFNGRGEANVHLVWEEWFWDSLEFGGRFDESKYPVRHPRPQPRKSQKLNSPPPSPDTFTAQDDTLQSSHPDHQSQEPNDAEEELADIRRLPAATLQLWGSLLGRRGYEVSDGKVLRSPSKTRAPSVLQMSPQVSEKTAGNGSLISQFRRSNSFAPARPEAPTSGRPQPFRRTRTTSAMNSNPGAAGSFLASARPQPEKHGESSTSPTAMTSNMFAGLKFTALGEAKSPSVRNAIEEHGGKFFLEMEDTEVDYIIVRLVSGSKIYREELDESQRVKYRTECWLERCVFEDRTCPAQDHITFSPLNIQTPVAGAEIITLSFSGLDQSEACWIKRLLRALGVNLAQFLSRRTTYLLCPSGTGAKFDKACEWGIPVVNMGWLEAIATAGIIPPVSAFLLPGSSVKEPAPVDEAIDIGADLKGKGKAVDKGKGVILVEDSIMEALPATVADNGPHATQSPRRSKRADLALRGPSSPLQRTPLKSISFGRPTGALALPSHDNCLPVTSPHSSYPNPELSIFGKATGALAAAPLPQLPVTTPTRTRSTPVIRTTPQHTSRLKTLSAPNADSTDPTRKPTHIEIERERRQIRIPSSKSPSPMKIPRQPKPKRLLTESPTSLPREVTKALQDNIVSLLGKRQPPEDEAAINARAGKRPRPQRPKKAQSRQPSVAQISEISVIPASAYDDSMSPFETYDELNLLESSIVDDSMRVTYEDPGQREERRRLMSLLKVGGADDMNGKAGGKESSRIRRSSRIAGF